MECRWAENDGESGDGPPWKQNGQTPTAWHDGDDSNRWEDASYHQMGREGNSRAMARGSQVNVGSPASRQQWNCNSNEKWAVSQPMDDSGIQSSGRNNNNNNYFSSQMQSGVQNSPHGMVVSATSGTMSDPYESIMRTTEKDMLATKTRDLLLGAETTQESVVGVSKCLLYWATTAEMAPFIVRCMADIYCMQSMPEPKKLSIFYIFNDCVQRNPGVFAAVGYHCFLLIIAPVVALLSENTVNSHLRTISILRSRGVYSREAHAHLRAIMTTKRHAVDTTSSTAEFTTPVDLDAQIHTDADWAAVRSRVSAILRATRITSRNPSLSDRYSNIAFRLLAASGRSFDSTEQDLRAINRESAEFLSSCLSYALNFATFELQRLHYLLLDWALLAVENYNSIQLLAEFLQPKETPTTNNLPNSTTEPNDRGIGGGGGVSVNPSTLLQPVSLSDELTVVIDQQQSQKTADETSANFSDFTYSNVISAFSTE